MRSEKSGTLVEALESRIAPAATVSLVVGLATGGDADGDGLPDAGDTLHYTVTVQNSGPGSLSGMSFTELINDPNLTLVANSINVSPLAIDESFNVVGNTLLRVGGTAGSGPELFVAGVSITANDYEFLGDTFTLAPLTNFATAHGVVNLASDGTFTYLPDAGYTGADSFTYTISDKGIDGVAGTPDDLTSTGTVTLNVTGKIWYVDNSFAGTSTGTSIAPFKSLSAISGATGPDLANDTIYVAAGSGAYTGGMTLLSGQSFIGQGSALTFTLPAGTPSGLATLETAGTAPTLTNVGGTALTLSTGNTLKGFTIGDSTRDILGSNFGTLSVSNVTLNGTGKALDLTTGTFASGSAFNSIASTGTIAGLHGLSLTSVGGSVNFGSTTISGSGAQAVLVSNSTADITFGNTAIGTGTAGSGSGANVEAIRFDGATGARTFGTLSIKNTGSNSDGLVDVNGSGSLTITDSALFDGIAANAIEISGAVNVGFQNLTISNTGGRAIYLLSHTGTFSATGGSIGTTTGTDVEISGGTGAVTIPLNITNTAGRSILIDNHETGAVTFSGTISDTGSGILVQNSNSGTITFSGSSKGLNTGANAAVTLSNNTGGTIDFTNGNLVITTTSGAGFNASGGGTISVQGSGNTIASGTGTALNIANTTIAGTGATFKTISANGAASGIVLNNTGTLGSLALTGTTTTGSGGTIQNTTSHAVSLTSTKTPTLNYLNITNTGADGINASSLTAGLNLNNLQITNAGDGDNENGLTLFNVGGTVSIQGTSFTNVAEEFIEIDSNNNSSMTLLVGTTAACTFTLPNTLGGIRAAGAFAGNGILITARGSSSYNVNISNSTFTDIKGFGFQFGGDGTTAGANNNITLNNNKFLVTVTNALGNANNRANAINIQGRGTVDIDASITNNQLDKGGGGGIQLGADESSNINAIISGNTISNQFADGILIAVDENASLTVLIDNNTITNTSSDGMEIANAISPDGKAATLNATITNNTVTGHNNNSGGNAFFGGIVVFGGADAADSTFVNINGNTVGGNPSPGTFFDYVLDGSSFGDAITVQGAGVGAVFESDFLAAPAPQNTSNSSAGGKTFIGNAFYSNGATVTQPVITPLLFAPSPTDGAAVHASSTPVSVVDHPVPEPDEANDAITIGTVTPVGPSPAVDGLLSQAKLDMLVAAAIQRWEAAGITAAQKALLQDLIFSVADLPGWYLGQSSNGQITLDADAAGNSWFVDTTPLDDSEYTNNAGVLTAAAAGAAAGRLDALTTVMHEMGHALGLDDTYADTDGASLMYGYLHLGERRVAAANQADGAMPSFHDGMDFLFGSMSLGSAVLPAGKSLTIVYDALVGSGTTAATVSSQAQFSSSGGTVNSNTVTSTIDYPDVSLSVSPASVGEDSGGNLIYTFTRQGPFTNPLTVNFNVSGGAIFTADSSTDYTQAGAATFSASAGTVTFAAGASTATVTITPKADSTVEANETVALTLASGTAYDIGTPSAATGTITNDDSATISISGGSVSEGASGTANLPFTITLSNPADVDVTVQFSTANGTATAGSDYVAQSAQTVTILAGQTIATKNVVINGDSTVELDESVLGTIGSLNAGGRNVSLGTVSAQGTITNDDTATLTLSGGSVIEGNSGTANLPFTVTLSNPADVAVTVQFSTADLTALAGSDYTAQSGVTVTIPAGQTSATQYVLVAGDTTVERNETITGSVGALLAGGRSVALGTSTATGTIVTDDSATISINGGTVAEGNSGTANLPFTVTLTNPVDHDVTVAFSTADLTALAGTDYAAQSGVTVTIPAGQTSVTHNVLVSGDTTVELNETVSGTIGSLDSGGRNVGLVTSSATGTITNDDFATVALIGGSVLEGNSGTANVPFTVTLSNPVDVDVTMQFSSEDASAVSGIDYTGQSGITVTIPAGQLTATLYVAVNGDLTVEQDETFGGFVDVLGNSGRSVWFDSISATGTILNDDSATVSISAGSVAEGNSGTANLPFTVTLSNPVDTDVTLQFSTSDLTAIAPGDYAAQSAVTVTILAGQTTATRNVLVNGDDIVELNETLSGSISGLNSGGRNVSIATNSATGTILNDDSATVSLSAGSVTEGNSGTANLPFTVTLSNPVDVDVTVQFSTADLTAMAPGDYSAQSGLTVTIPAGQLTATQDVLVNGDSDVEANETLSGSINGLASGARAVAFGTTSATGTILNDDASVTVTVLPSAVVEDGSGNLVYTFTRSGFTGAPLTVDFSVAGSAIFTGNPLTTDYTQTGADSFNATTGSTTFASGSDTATLTIDPTADPDGEGDETVSLTVLAGNGYTVGAQGAATGSILDDDTLVSVAVAPITVTENSGGSMVYTFTRTGNTATDLTVNFSVGGTALFASDYTHAGASAFTSTAGSVIIPAGATSATITLTALNDLLVESTETAILTVSTGAGYGIATPSIATGSISDDDTAIISITKLSDGTEGGSNGKFRITQSLASSTDTVLAYTIGGSAAGGVDYAALTGVVTIPAGQTFADIDILVTDDSTVELTESVSVTLNSISSGDGDISIDTAAASAAATITDNDQATITIAPIINAAEFDSIAGKFRVTQSLVSTTDTILSYSVAGSATAGADYAAVSGTVTIPAGQTFADIDVAVLNDTLVEGTQGVEVTLASVTAGNPAITLASSGTTASIDIIDNDSATLSINLFTFVTEQGGAQNIIVTLTTSDGAGGPATLESALSANVVDGAFGTASSGSDYLAFGVQSLTFAAGSGDGATQVANFTSVNDRLVEGGESATFALQNLSSSLSGQAILGNANATVIITDNDTATISFAAATSNAPEGATPHGVGVTLTINADGDGPAQIASPIVVSVSDTLIGTASSGADYAFTNPSTVTFAAGDGASTKEVIIGVIDDNLSEGNETVGLQITGISNSTEGQVALGSQSTHTATIVDNDIDLKLTKTESVASVVAGSGAGNLTYTITLQNTGLTDATGVVIGEDLTLLAGTSLVSVTPSAGAFAATTGPDGTWTLDLAAGTSATLTVVVTVGSSAAAGVDVIGDTATITASNENRINTSDESATEHTSIQRLVDLQVTKSDNVDSVTPGDVVSYAIEVSNTQPSDATGVVLSETLPLGAAFNAGASTPGWVSVGGGVYTFDIGTVPGNGSATPVTFAVTVDSAVDAGQDTFDNTVTVSDDGSAGVDPGVNTATDSDVLNAAPNLHLVKTGPSASVQRGGTIAYTLSYSNLGNQDATGVVITETLPQNTTINLLLNPGWSQTGPGTFEYFIGNVAAGASAQAISFIVDVDTTLPAGTIKITNTATVADDAANGADSDSADDTATLDSLIYQGIYVVAPGVSLPRKGAPADVRVFDIASNTELFSISAYEANYRDSVRVAVGDMNGDGYDDIITSTRKGTGRVRVFDGLTGAQFEGVFSQIDPFDGRKQKGAFVAAGDVNGDGRDDLIVGSALGGGALKIYDGVTGDLLSTSTPFGTKFRGGVRVAVGDLDGDGTDEIVAGQGYYGASVKVLDLAGEGESIQFNTVTEFKVGSAKFKGGVSVAVTSDADGDGKDDIVVGRNTGRPTQVDIYGGISGVVAGNPMLPFGTKYNLGVRVAAADVNFDGVADIIAAAGGRGRSQVKFFDGATRTELADFAFTAIPTHPSSALFVAASYPVPVAGQVMLQPT